MAKTNGYDYFIGPLYYWRYNRDTERVEVFSRPNSGPDIVWLDEDRFQGLYEKRWLKNVRYVSADVFFREGNTAPFAVKDGNVVMWHQKEGTKH